MARYSVVDYTPTISGSSGVAAGQILSATESIGNVESGWLDSIIAYDLGDSKRGFTMYLYGANVSVGAESATFAPSDTATDDLITMVTFSSGGQLDLTNSVFYLKSASKADAGMGVWCQPSIPSTDALIYCALTVASTGTCGTGSLQFKFRFRHD